jgi:predicted permease
VEDLLRDVRFSLRLLVKERTLSGTILLTLALCLGANVAIYGVIHAVLLEPLPFPDPERLVTVYNSYPGAGATRGGNGSFDFFQRREKIEGFEEVAIYQGAGSTVGEAGGAERVPSLRVTPSFFPLLGIEPALGRAFTDDEMDPGNERKVLLTHGYWTEQLGGDPNVLEREMRIDGRPYEIVGVLPEDLSMPFRAEARFFLPLAFNEVERSIERWHSNNYEMIARLREGATVEQAAAQNAALNDALIEITPLPNARQLLEDIGYRTVIVPAADDMVRDVKPVLYLLWAGVVFTLLIGCVNIANLMLARAQTRVGEVATQLALGARAARVARQVFTHSVVLGLLGGALGVGIGALGLRLLQGLGTDQLPRGTDVGIDGPVLAFTLLLSVGAGALFGAIPVAQVLEGDLSPVFRGGGRGGTASRRAVLVRNALVTGQISLAFLMLIGAGLMLMSFRAALAVEPGFQPSGLLTASVSLPSARYPEADDRRAFWDDLLGQVRALPGVEDASLTTVLPLSGNNSSNVAYPEGYVVPAGESILAPVFTIAGPDYFQAMGIEVIQGRGFEEGDGPDQTRVTVIDEWLANRYWPGRSPIGARLIAGVAPGDSVADGNLFTVVGVVRTIKHNDLTAPSGEHVGAYYATYRQGPPNSVTLTVRAEGGGASADDASHAESLSEPVRGVLARLDPELPLFGVQSMSQRVDDSLLRRRVPLLLLGVFAGVALFLAVVGIYGALSYTVSQRTREIGVRMAMGSSPGRLFNAVVGQGLRVTALGLLIGGVASLFLTRLLGSLLFGVQPTDLRVIGAVTLLLAVVGLIACIVPARRATTVNPVEALIGQ